MAIFKVNNQKLISIKEKKIDLEKDIQKITEKNLEEVFGLKFVCSEFQMNGLRIDTLAWNEESSSFVIIEYKRDRSFSIIDQGYSYLSLMLNNKADYILEYNEKMKNTLKREDVDWTQSRVIFIANSFTTYQQNAINFKDLPIELWEVKKYENDIIQYNKLTSPESSESIKTISSRSKTVTEVSNEVVNYSIDDLFRENWHQTREIFDILNDKILSLDPNIRQNIVKNYVGYKIGNKNIVLIKMFKMGPCIEFLRSEPNDFNDPESLVKYMANSFRFYNQHVSYYQLKGVDDVDSAWKLIKQAYNRFIGKE